MLKNLETLLSAASVALPEMSMTQWQVNKSNKEIGINWNHLGKRRSLPLLLQCNYYSKASMTSLHLSNSRLRLLVARTHSSPYHVLTSKRGLPAWKSLQWNTKHVLNFADRLHQSICDVFQICQPKSFQSCPFTLHGSIVLQTQLHRLHLWWRQFKDNSSELRVTKHVKTGMFHIWIISVHKEPQGQG